MNLGLRPAPTMVMKDVIACMANLRGRTFGKEGKHGFYSPFYDQAYNQPAASEIGEVKPSPKRILLLF